MKLINQKAELLIQPKGINGLEKQIEIAARTCYKSENKSTGDSKPFVDKLIKMKHFSMLEQGTVYLYVDGGLPVDTFKLSYMFKKYYENPYSRVKWNPGDPYLTVTTNYRVIKEHGWEDDLKYLCEPTGNHVKRYTFRLTTSISIGRELTRHRAFSFAQESSRYCRYSDNKFDNELTFIVPSIVDCPVFFSREDGTESAGFVFSSDNPHPKADAELYRQLESAEKSYMILLDNGYSPQFAREVLPLCTKSELIMTGFEDDWKNFLDVRFKGTTGRPHPDMVELAQMIQDELNKIQDKQ